MLLLMLLCYSHEPIGPQLYPVIYVVANLVLYVACWTGKDQRNIYKAPTRACKQKQKERKNDTKHKPEKDRRRALDSESLV